MSRYIDADAFLKEYCEPYPLVYTAMSRAMADAPSIDIVRCKECKWGKPYSDKQLECDALGLGGLKFPNDFCSYGCREEE